MKPLRIVAVLFAVLTFMAGPASQAMAQETPAAPAGPTPALPPAGTLSPEAEQALRARVEQFWSLWVGGQRVKALELVAEDSRDAFLASPVPVVEGFRFDKIVPQASPGVAVAYVMTERRIPHPAFKDPLNVAHVTVWKQINGEWYLTMNEEAVMETPFGPIRFRPGAGSNEMKKLVEEKAKQVDLEAVKEWTREHDKIVIAPPGVEVRFEKDKNCKTPEQQKSKECQAKKEQEKPKPAPPAPKP